ncbi:MAG: cob(I)yrinic acid a,c-diamide adenosyltransferase [Patescibacteria group bacterium]|nr:cob(I)yrinic acid a,c-diamide adenosyltransferase [Patescibacteria group bacterium]
MTKQSGLVYILTGEGKGKTTAAFGLAMRSAGHNKRVLIVQFIKNNQSGEVKYLSQIAKSPALPAGRQKLTTKLIDIHVMGSGFVGILADKKSKKTHQKSAEEALLFLRKSVKGNQYDLVILDEINVAIDLGLIDLNEVAKFLRTKPQALNVVLTGRKAHKELIDLADMVSEIKNIKHPFNSGLPTQKGIDY